jgi:hypothetical protein
MKYIISLLYPIRGQRSIPYFDYFLRKIVSLIFTTEETEGKLGEHGEFLNKNQPSADG